MNKKEYLNKLYEKYGDFEVFSMDKHDDGKIRPNWGEWRKYSQVQKDPSAIEQANHRTIFPNEIVLDIEDKTKLDDIKRQLNELSLAYEIWTTHSRGYHIHLWFKEIEILNSSNRTYAKEKFIKHFNCDVQKKAERNQIALEYANHWKSKKPKELIDKVSLIRQWVIGDESAWNFMPNFVFEALNKKKKERVIKSSHIYANFLQDPFLKAALREKLPEGERNKVLFKNIAIGLYNSGLTEDQMQEYIKQIAEVQEENVGAITGWLDKAKKGELVKVNRAELQQWAINNKLKIKYRPESLVQYSDYTSALVLDDWIYEQVFNYKNGTTCFCGYNTETKQIKYFDYVIEARGDELIEWYPIKNTMLATSIYDSGVKLSSQPKEYGSIKDLNNKIKEFIHKYLDIPKDRELFASWYPFVSFVYDRLNTINYLRSLGTMGVGKTRFIDVIGELCYKPMKTSGNVNPAPLYRMIELWKGTLIINELNPRDSSAQSDIIQIFNSGFERNSGGVWRCIGEGKNLDIKNFQTFGPKVFNSRFPFLDEATESRCISVTMEQTDREDIPDELPPEFFTEAQEIRDMLLMYRFKNRNILDLKKGNEIKLSGLSRRLRQASRSFFSVIAHDEEAVETFRKYLFNYEKEMIDERANSREGAIINSIYAILKEEGLFKISIKRIIDKLEKEYRWKNVSPQALGKKLKPLKMKTKQIRFGEGWTTIIDWERSNWEKNFIYFVPNYEVGEFKDSEMVEEQVKLEFKEEKPKEEIKDENNEDPRVKNQKEFLKKAFGDENEILYDFLKENLFKMGIPIAEADALINLYKEKGYIMESKKGHYMIVE